MNKLKQYIAKIDELTLRERAIVFGAVLLGLTLGWYTYLIEPLAKEEKKLAAELSAKRRQVQTLNEQFELMTRRQHSDPDEENRDKLAELRADLAEIKAEIESAASQLVSPENMPDILRQVLNKSQGLTLMKLVGLGSTSLVTANNQGSEQAEKNTVQNGDLGSAYKHGMQIQFTGSFFETLEYMYSLEQLKWGFFWDSISFEIKEYPAAATTLTLYTLSLGQDWIGI